MITYAIGPLLQADQLIHNPTCDNDIMACNSLPIYLTLTDEHNNIVSIINGNFNVTSKTSFFVNNKINYETQVDVIGSKNVSQIYFILTPKDANMSLIEKLTPAQLLTEAKNNQELIDLQPLGNNQFHRTGFWTPVLTNDIVLVAVVEFSDNTATMPSEKSPVLVSIGSQKDKSDAEQSQESRISSEVILGLTWMGVSIAPMLLGSDMILRVIFEG